MSRTPWRWIVAGWLGKLPNTCWAELVSWAQRTRYLRDGISGKDCRAESLTARDRCCWCNKFQNGCVGKRASELSS